MTTAPMFGVTLVALASCGRVDFDTVGSRTDDARRNDTADDGAALQPIHVYELGGNYNDTYGGPPLVGQGGTFTAGGYQFGMNQGLTLDGAMPPSVYTVDIIFSFTTITSWRKIIDFKNLAVDEGLYVYEGALQMVIVQLADFETSTATITPNVTLRMTLTRDAATHVAGYLDRVGAPSARSAAPDIPTAPTGPFEYDDSMGVAVVQGTSVTFFVDDTPTGQGEAAPGTVRRIAIYDVALTAAQVAALP